MTNPIAALERLLSPEMAPNVAGSCREFGVDLLVGFGSSARTETAVARDLDLAFSRHDRGSSGNIDVLAFLDRLVALGGCETVDLLDLDRAGSVARAEALLGGVPIFEAEPGIFAREQMAAFTEREDSAWLRKLELDLLSQ